MIQEVKVIHYNNIFLVKAEDKEDAIRLVKEFLEPYDESLENDYERSEDYYYNADGQWDWYVIGGRWSWSTLVDEYRDYISYRDKDMRYYHHRGAGNVDIKFPDGIVMKNVEYGFPVERAIHDWIEQHPTLSEVIDGNDLKFWDILDKYKDITKRNIDDAKQTYERWKDDKSMSEWAKRRLDDVYEDKWAVDRYFWNIYSDNQVIDIDEINKDKSHWFLVNCDLHS